ncbi:rCG20070, partial [Rattus norvegicus]
MGSPQVELSSAMFIGLWVKTSIS